MAFIKGENLNLGVAPETVRGTFVTPVRWIPARTPTGINVEVIKAMIKETRGSCMTSQGSEVVQRRASGDIEFNLRSEGIGYILRSLLGSVVSAVKETTAFDHTFSILAADPQHPTLSLGLSQQGQQDYHYNGAMVTSLELRTPVDDLVNATVQFIARDEVEQADMTPAFDNADVLFRPFDVSIKFAANKAGLDAAPAINVKEFDISMVNNGREQQNIGSITPTDVIGSLFEITGNIVIDYQGKTYHDYFRDGTYNAMRIDIERTDITIGASSTPKLRIDMPKISLESTSPDRPIDDIVRDSFGFQAHYDETETEGIDIILTNEVTDYTS